MNVKKFYSFIVFVCGLFCLAYSIYYFNSSLSDFFMGVGTLLTFFGSLSWGYYWYEYKEDKNEGRTH